MGKLLFMGVVMVLSQVVTSGSDYFVNFWTQQEDLRLKHEDTALTPAQCCYISGAFIIGVVIVSV